MNYWLIVTFMLFSHGPANQRFSPAPESAEAPQALSQDAPQLSPIVCVRNSQGQWICGHNPKDEPPLELF